MTAPTGRVDDGGMVGDCWDLDGGWQVIALDPGSEDDDCVYVRTPHSRGGDVVAVEPEEARGLAAALIAAASRVDGVEA